VVHHGFALKTFSLEKIQEPPGPPENIRLQLEMDDYELIKQLAKGGQGTTHVVCSTSRTHTHTHTNLHTLAYTHTHSHTLQHKHILVRVHLCPSTISSRVHKDIKISMPMSDTLHGI